MLNCIVFVVTFCCVVTRRTFPQPKMPLIERWKSLKANRRKRSSCAAHLDLRAFTSEMTDRRPYPRCSRQSSSILKRGEISPKSKKRRNCSSTGSSRVAMFLKPCFRDSILLSWLSLVAGTRGGNNRGGYVEEACG